jgi:hypothetical protein
MTSQQQHPAARAGAPFEIVLRGTLVPSVVCGALAVVGCAVVRGPASILSGVIGLAVAVGFFASGLLLLSRLLRDRNPLTFMAVGMAIYLAQVLALLAFMIAFLNAAWLDGRAFGIVAFVVTIAWQGFSMRAWRQARILVYDEPFDGKPQG